MGIFKKSKALNVDIFGNQLIYSAEDMRIEVQQFVVMVEKFWEKLNKVDETDDDAEDKLQDVTSLIYVFNAKSKIKLLDVADRCAKGRISPPAMQAIASTFNLLTDGADGAMAVIIQKLVDRRLKPSEGIAFFERAWHNAEMEYPEEMKVLQQGMGNMKKWDWINETTWH